MSIEAKLEHLHSLDVSALAEAMDSLGWRGVDPGYPLDVIEQKLRELGDEQTARDWIEADLDALCEIVQGS